MERPVNAPAISLWLLLGASLAGCGGRGAAPAPATPPAPAAGAGATAAATPEDPARAAAEGRASEVADRLAKAVMGELTKALQAGPPESAVHVCGEAAQRVTAEVAAAEGIALRRTALRLRNPTNAPDAFERAALEAWAAPGATPAAQAEVVEAGGGGRALRYLRPIVLQPMCVTCHGAPEEVPAAVRAALAERYPEDRATGFRPGDLRGALSVTVPIAGAAAGR
jgi:hypothetical protein